MRCSKNIFVWGLKYNRCTKDVCYGYYSCLKRFDDDDDDVDDLRAVNKFSHLILAKAL